MSIFNLLFTRSIPESLRFNGFSAAHYAYLAASALFITLTAIYAKRASRAKREKTLRFFVLAMPCVYAFRFITFLFLEKYVEPQTSLLDRLPIHLCSLNAVVMPLAVFKRNKTLLNFIYALSIPGAAAAMLTPALSYFGQYYYLSWQVAFFFLEHSLIVLAPVLAVVCGLFRPDPKAIPKVLAIFLPYAGVIYVVNKIFNENLLFLNGPDQGTVLAVFAAYLGNPGYIGALAALTAAVIFLMYLPWAVASRRRRKNPSVL